MTEGEKKKLRCLLDYWGNTYKITKNFERDISDYKHIKKTISDMESMWVKDISEKRVDTENLIKENKEMCIDLIKQTNIKLNKALRLKDTLDNIIDTLEISQMLIIKGKHIKKYNWEILPLNLPFKVSKRHAQRLYNKALNTIFKALENNEELKWFFANTDNDENSSRAS